MSRNFLQFCSVPKPICRIIEPKASQLIKENDAISNKNFSKIQYTNDHESHNQLSIWYVNDSLDVLCYTYEIRFSYMSLNSWRGTETDRLGLMK